MVAIPHFRCADIFKGKQREAAYNQAHRLLLFHTSKARFGLATEVTGYCAELRNADCQTIAAFCPTNRMPYNTSCSQSCLLQCPKTLICCSMRICKHSSIIYCQRNLSAQRNSHIHPLVAAKVVVAAPQQRPMTMLRKVLWILNAR